MTERGTVTIPKPLRDRAPHTDLFEVVLREDGVFELQPRVAANPAQGWFWTERWQSMEKEADEEYAAGRWQRFADADSLIADLDAYAAQADEQSGEVRP